MDDGAGPSDSFFRLPEALRAVVYQAASGTRDPTKNVRTVVIAEAISPVIFTPFGSVNTNELIPRTKMIESAPARALAPT